MTPLKSALQLLFLGVLLVSPAYLQPNPCEIVRNRIPRGSYKLKVEPAYYKAGEIYTVSITGIDNSTSVILQALSPESRSDGLWENENHPVNCGSADTLVQRNISGSGTETLWTSPRNTNMDSAQIRAFVTFANGTTLLQTWDLDKEIVTASTPVPTPHAATRVHNPTLRSNMTNAHTNLNATVAHHNFASSHQGTKGPHGSVSVAQASSSLLVVMQFLSVFVGYKLLS